MEFVRPRMCPDINCKVLVTNCNRESNADEGDKKSYFCTGKVFEPIKHGQMIDDYAICFYTRDKGHIHYFINKGDVKVYIQPLRRLRMIKL